MKQLTITTCDHKPPVAVQRLLGGRFVAISIFGPVLSTKIVLTDEQTRALARALITNNYNTDTTQHTATTQVNH